MLISNLFKDKIHTEVDAYLFFEIGNLSYSKSDSLGSSFIISLGLINEYDSALIFYLFKAACFLKAYM